MGMPVPTSPRSSAFFPSSVQPVGPQGLKEIDPSSVVLGRELGQGEFGSVLMGTWTNEEGKKVSSQCQKLSCIEKFLELLRSILISVVFEHY